MMQSPNNLNRSVKAKCTSCGKVAHPFESTSNGSQVFHNSCFKCSKCQTVPAWDFYELVEGTVFCKVHAPKPGKEDQKKSSLNGSSVPVQRKSQSQLREKCPVCEKTAYPAESYPFKSKLYHKTCFRCSNCKTSLTPGTCFSNNSHLYCKIHIPTPKASAVADSKEMTQAIETQRKIHDAIVASNSEESNKPLFSTDLPSLMQAQQTIIQVLPRESADLIERGAKDNQTIFFCEPDIKENADLIPQLKLHIPYETQINEKLFVDIKAELDMTLGPGNFAILGIEKGSVILKIAAFIKNIVKQACSAVQEYAKSFEKKLEEIGVNKTFFECIEKVRVKTFYCLKGTKADSIGISQVPVREEIKEFLKESKIKGDQLMIQQDSALSSLTKNWLECRKFMIMQSKT